MHWVVKEEVAQTRVRLCQPSPQVIEQELQEDHSSDLASTVQKHETDGQHTRNLT